ncbi:hypothetical protein ANCDUO_16680 [Ancylostoma duodenale]|uniref:Uncharacterized protein n=1 Tax=Ancylostoma duodenale TaxID=51022 RepID=A0A0C2CTS8_9BILA|nr:hypothetical protein ANCDUO_16680 [Ancylostoma duodenale]
MYSETGLVPCQLCPRHTFSGPPIVGVYNAPTRQPLLVKDKLLNQHVNRLTAPQNNAKTRLNVLFETTAQYVIVVQDLLENDVN